MNLLDLKVPPLPPMLCLGGCGKLLWDPKARKLRYGRDCAEKLGIAVPPSPHASRRPGGYCEGQTNLLEDTMAKVWVTGAGDRYHTTRNCLGLESGQAGGEAQGYELREPVEMDLNVAEAAGKTACGTCGGATR